MQISNLKPCDILRKYDQGNQLQHSKNMKSFIKSIALKYQMKYMCFKNHLEPLLEQSANLLSLNEQIEKF